MKLITAIVRPEKLEDVKIALFAVQVTGMTITQVAGHGGERDPYATYFRGAPLVNEFHEKIRFDIAVSEPFVQATVDAILKSAKTGDAGDGKIFIRPLEQVVRIRTGETDLDALTPDPMRFPGIMEAAIPGC
jgi:nitrogen regulatory protein P-II 1